MTPLVSIIIPAYNSARFIADSVATVLAQTDARYEVIVVDDGSSDDTRAVVRGLGDRIKYRYQDNQGPAAARNAGIRMALGEFICFLDADDEWMPDKLALQTAFMAAHPDVGLVFADAEESTGTTIEKPSILASMKFGADVRSQQPLTHAFAKLIVENFIPTSTVMIRASSLRAAGLFDETLQNAEDRDLWLRLSAVSHVACIPQVLARKRTHGANISARTEVALRSRIRVWSKARREWPALASATVYDEMLAGAYREVGYIELTRGERRAARRSGVASVCHAVRYFAGTRSRLPHGWWLSVGLVPLSLVPWPFLRSVWNARNYALGRRALPWSGAAGAR